MRKIGMSIIALLIVTTFIAIGLRNGQVSLISKYFEEMAANGFIFPVFG
ncbi:MAG: hypothetical protein K9W44_02640 [Candidatus Lokiarchaeota archaeon]|nr:hypothetical protein [Candidatus Harpocratesius repetitus]